jgi:anaerobic selenocysteine-containing dehydrogenase
VPAAIRVNYGIQRSENGGTAARAVCMLPALTGAWKHAGGGLQFSLSGAFAFNTAKLQMPELAQASTLGRAGRVVNMVQLGSALTELDSPRVHGLMVYNSNPAAVTPNQTAVLAGLRRDDLFTVVHEQFFTDTADYADVVLPATTFLEHKEVQGAYGHFFVQASNQAIAPLGEARSNVWLFGQLARRMGFTEECFRDDEDALISQALESSSPWQSGISREELQRANRIELRFKRNADGAFLPFTEGAENGQATTPSGKIEFYSEALAAEGKDPMPAYVPARESRHAEAAKDFPLEMVARKADNFMNSTFANIPTHQHMEAGRIGVVELHAVDAAKRNIATGDAVEVFNSRGTVRMTAKVHEALPTGVVAAQLGWNKLAADGNGVNVLTNETLTDIGGGPTFYSVLVEVRKLSPSA